MQQLVTATQMFSDGLISWDEYQDKAMAAIANMTRAEIVLLAQHLTTLEIGQK